MVDTRTQVFGLGWDVAAPLALNKLRITEL
jgi:hypothetical protein